MFLELAGWGRCGEQEVAANMAAPNPAPPEGHEVPGLSFSARLTVRKGRTGAAEVNMFC